MVSVPEVIFGDSGSTASVSDRFLRVDHKMVFTRIVDRAPSVRATDAAVHPPEHNPASMTFSGAAPSAATAVSASSSAVLEYTDVGLFASICPVSPTPRRSNRKLVTECSAASRAMCTQDRPGPMRCSIAVVKKTMPRSGFPKEAAEASTEVCATEVAGWVRIANS